MKWHTKTAASGREVRVSQAPQNAGHVVANRRWDGWLNSGFGPENEKKTLAMMYIWRDLGSNLHRQNLGNCLPESMSINII